MRLSLAFDTGLQRPETCVVLHPHDDFDIAGLTADVVHPFRPTHDAWASRGMTVTPDRPGGRWDMAVVVAARSKAQTKDLIAWAAAHADVVVVDGQKTDGIDSYYKGIRKLTDVAGTITKGHGRLFWFEAIDLADWADTPADVDGFQTRAGVFSADGIDPASAMLAAHLPDVMKGSVLDLGAGWGFLSKHVLDREITSVDLVEADHVALECAKVNITDERAKFYWANAIKHKGKYDWVIMNPPFHKGREGDPGLGQAFIQTAAKCLAPGGKLLMVANAHLPYEATMEACFIKVETTKPDRRFKIFQASRPKR